VFKRIPIRHPCRIQLSVWVRSGTLIIASDLCGNGQCTSLQSCARTPTYYLPTVLTAIAFISTLGNLSSSTCVAT
jgi:hypothetical protein